MFFAFFIRPVRMQLPGCQKKLQTAPPMRSDGCAFMERERTELPAGTCSSGRKGQCGMPPSNGPRTGENSLEPSAREGIAEEMLSMQQCFRPLWVRKGKHFIRLNSPEYRAGERRSASGKNAQVLRAGTRLPVPRDVRHAETALSCRVSDYGNTNKHIQLSS